MQILTRLKNILTTTTLPLATFLLFKYNVVETIVDGYQISQVIGTSIFQSSLKPSNKLCICRSRYISRNNQINKLFLAPSKNENTENKSKQFIDPTTMSKEQLKNLFGDILVEPNKYLNKSSNNKLTQSRLRLDRSYAREEPFSPNNINLPPTLDDLTAQTKTYSFSWLSVPSYIFSLIVSYFIFPYLTQTLNYLVIDIDMKTLDEITTKFATGISILYGSFISLTLAILYGRQCTIQDNISFESSQLVVLTRTMLSLFCNNPKSAVEAGQCIADQIHTLVKGSRGTELMLLIYSDPYARMMDIVDNHEDVYILSENDNTIESDKILKSNLSRSRGLIENYRNTIQDLYRARAHRLSDESLALPSVHFYILNVLTILLLLTYLISIVPTMSVGRFIGEPSKESAIFFALLSTTYFMFYNFATDLNNPYGGTYQIKRSTSASHLLQLKWLLSNHPLTNNGKIDFNKIDHEEEEPNIVDNIKKEI